MHGVIVDWDQFVDAVVDCRWLTSVDVCHCAVRVTFARTSSSLEESLTQSGCQRWYRYAVAMC